MISKKRVLTNDHLMVYIEQAIEYHITMTTTDREKSIRFDLPNLGTKEYSMNDMFIQYVTELTIWYTYLTKMVFEEEYEICASIKDVIDFTLYDYSELIFIFHNQNVLDNLAELAEIIKNKHFEEI